MSRLAPDFYMANFYNELSERQKEAVKRFSVLFVVLLNIALVFWIFYYAVGSLRLWNPAPESGAQVSFSGEGKISAKPDIASVTLTVLTPKASLGEAQKDSTERSNKLVGFLKGEGIAEKDIKTVSYNIYPQYSYPKPCPLGLGIPCIEERSPRIIGYQVRHTLEVKVRNLDKAGRVLEGAVSAGANEVSNFQFAIDDENKLREEARRLAIEDAKKKAKVLARQLGVRLGRIVSFSESGFPGPIFYRAEALGKGGGVAPEVPEVQPGENEIRVNVSITYELK